MENAVITKHHSSHARKWLFLSLVIPFIGAEFLTLFADQAQCDSPPATQPAAAPRQNPSKALKRLIMAHEALDSAYAAALDRAKQSDTYTAAKKQLSNAQQKQADAVASGTREDKAVAREAVQDAQSHLDQVQQSVALQDPAVVSARRSYQKAHDTYEKLRWTELLDQVDVTADIDRGNWKFVGNTLVGNEHNPVERAEIHMPTVLPDSYDLSLTFRRSGKGGGPFITFPVGQQTVMLELDSQGPTCSGLSRIYGQNSNQNETRKLGRLIRDDRTHQVEISVRIDGDQADITAFFDQENIVNWHGKQAVLSPPQFFKTPDPHTVALSAWSNRVYFDSVKYGAPMPDSDQDPTH
jgi:hypothetical protein